MKKLSIKVIKDKKMYILETNRDLKIFENVLRTAWGKKRFKEMCKFYESLSPNLDQALAKAFPR